MANVDSSLFDAKQIDLLNGLLADVTELRTQFIAALAKLDADGGVTDVDYESTLTPAALTTTT